MKIKLLRFNGYCAVLSLLVLTNVSLYAVESGGFAKVSVSENRVWVTSTAELVEYLTQEEGCTIYIKGSFNFTEKCYVASNKVLVGLAEGAEITGQGFVMDSVSNIVLDNLDLSGIESQVIKIGSGSKHIWVNQCSFIENDSLCLEVCPGADSITISGNKFEDCSRLCTIGHGDISKIQGDLGLRVTMFHNKMVGSSELCLDVRHSPLCHLMFNNISSNDSVTNILAVEGAMVLVEAFQFYYDSNSVVTEYDSLEMGHVTIKGGVHIPFQMIDTLVPEPTYTCKSMLLTDLRVYWDEYNWQYCGAGDIAAQYNAASDYDGVGVVNYVFGMGRSIIAQHSGRAITFAEDPENDSRYTLIQGGKNCEGNGNYSFDIKLSDENEGDWDVIRKEFYNHEVSFATGHATVEDDGEIAFTEGMGDGEFRFQKVDEGVYRIISYTNDKCLEIENASLDSGAAVVLGTCRSGKTNQMFRVIGSWSWCGFKSADIIEPISQTEISVYPNPANSELNIAVPESMLDKAYSVEIVDAIGQKVFERTEMEGEINTIDIGNLPRGMYMVRLTQGKQIISKKLIKN